jgi:hypothetical protein
MSVLSFGCTPEELRFVLLIYLICVSFMTRVILFPSRVLPYARQEYIIYIYICIFASFCGEALSRLVCKLCLASLGRLDSGIFSFTLIHYVMFIYLHYVKLCCDISIYIYIIFLTFHCDEPVYL